MLTCRPAEFTESESLAFKSSSTSGYRCLVKIHSKCRVYLPCLAAYQCNYNRLRSAINVSKCGHNVTGGVQKTVARLSTVRTEKVYGARVRYQCRCQAQPSFENSLDIICSLKKARDTTSIKPLTHLRPNDSPTRKPLAPSRKTAVRKGCGTASNNLTSSSTVRISGILCRFCALSDTRDRIYRGPSPPNRV